MVHYHWTLKWDAFFVFLFWTQLCWLHLYFCIYMELKTCSTVCQWTNSNTKTTSIWKVKEDLSSVVGHKHTFYHSVFSPWLRMWDKNFGVNQNSVLRSPRNHSSRCLCSRSPGPTHSVSMTQGCNLMSS